MTTREDTRVTEYEYTVCAALLLLLLLLQCWDAA